MGKRNIIEKGMTQNMERINRGENGRRRKLKVKGRGKVEESKWKGKTGDKARNSDSVT